MLTAWGRTSSVRQPPGDERKVRDSNSHSFDDQETGLANRPGQPYPATFRIVKVTKVGVEPTNSPGSRPGRFSHLRTRPSTPLRRGRRKMVRVELRLHSR